MNRTGCLKRKHGYCRLFFTAGGLLCVMSAYTNIITSLMTLYASSIRTAPSICGSGVNQTTDPWRTPNSRSNQKFLISKETCQSYFNYSRLVHYVRCEDIFANDPFELNRAKTVVSVQAKQGIDANEYMALTQSCPLFLKSRNYILSPVTEEEDQLPLAFSILAYKDIELVERLLRAIYRPQNYYCIHMDMKASETDMQVIGAIVGCFSNVFLSSRSVDVHWGKLSVLEAELICMRDLWQYKKWRYFINLTGQEFPLKTNLELVKILKEMRGANVVEGTQLRRRPDLWEKPKTPPPHNITLVKGAVHIAVNREFVDFCLHDNRSHDFLEWLNSTIVPDETFFASLNHNPHLGIPGTFLGDAEEYPSKQTFTRYKNWKPGCFSSWLRPCDGKFSRGVCVLGLGDLHRLKDDVGLFANKFHLEFEYLALDCLEELILNRTRDQYLSGAPVDVSFYSRLDQPRLQLHRK